jgi:hypothetical protein
MNPSSALCRSQEALHRDRAAGTTLRNVRMVAERAATAWSQEALLAEEREQRQDRSRLTAVALLADKTQSWEEDDDPFCENPDRGIADA